MNNKAIFYFLLAFWFLICGSQFLFADGNPTGGLIGYGFGFLAYVAYRHFK